MCFSVYVCVVSLCVHCFKERKKKGMELSWWGGSRRVGGEEKYDQNILYEKNSVKK